MTAPAEILNQLQTAWGAAAIVSQPTEATPPLPEPKRIGDLLLIGNTAQCNGHLPPFDAIEQPDKRRPGFIRSKCRNCGRFLGYRRTD